MNIPSFWAVYTLEVPFKNKTTKIKRYGWSNDSVKSAKLHAIERCEQAKHILLTTGSVKRIEPKGSYSIDGLPIREEVVQKYPELNCVTTINVYGSTCLNSEDVMILDIDNEELQPAYIRKTEGTSNAAPKDIEIFWALLPPLLLVASIYIFGILIEAGLQLFIFGILVGFFVWSLSSINLYRWKRWLNNQGGLDGMLDKFIISFLDKYPDMAFNIYKTPLGFRLIALDKTYSPHVINAQRCFDELPVDKKYARLCQLQNCFRGRVTAKPWNIAECEPRIPVRDFWVDGEMRQERGEWLEHYHKLESSYSACRFVKQIGTHRSPDRYTDEEREQQRVDKVIALHDGLSRSHSRLPLA